MGESAEFHDGSRDHGAGDHGAGGHGAGGRGSERLPAVDALHAVIGTLLEVDVADLSDDELGDAVVELQRAESRLVAAGAGFVRQWDERGVWGFDGSRSPGAALARDAGLSGPHASAVVRRARQLADMRRTADALAAGEISTDHVDLLARANAHDWPSASFADSEDLLLGFCRDLRFAHARRAIEYWIAHADADRDDREAHERTLRRHLTTSVTLDGTVHLHGLLDATGGAAFREELHRLERLLEDQDRRDGRERTRQQRRADALVEMAVRSRTAVAGGLRPRPLITVLVGEDSFRRTCELAEGIRVGPSQLVPMLGEADIERIVFDGPDRVMSVSRSRSFTGAVRRAVEVRDRWCRHPSGCDIPAARCDVDHVVPYALGGETSQENGRLACPRHNRDAAFRDRAPGEGTNGRDGAAPTSSDAAFRPPRRGPRAPDGDEGDDGDDDGRGRDSEPS